MGTRYQDKPKSDPDGECAWVDGPECVKDDMPDDEVSRYLAHFRRCAYHAAQGRETAAFVNKALRQADRPDHDSGEALARMDMERLRSIVDKEGPNIAKLGTWPPYVDVRESLSARIPAEGQVGPGFDAGLAAALHLIPWERWRLSAILHAAYTPEAVAQVRREAEKLDADPDSETVWWLAACSLCEEGTVDVAKFKEQLRKFDTLRNDPEARVRAARGEFQAMTSAFETDTFGVPYGTKDGCMQGAYLAGYPFATMFSSDYGLYFIGTFHDDLGLESFAWSGEKDEKDRPKSGPVHGSKQFVKCANEAEFRKAVAVVKERFASRPQEQEAAR